MSKYIVQLAELDWVKVLGIGLLVAVLYYFMLYDNGDALETRIKSAKDQVANAKSQLDRTEKAMNDANRFEKEAQATALQFEKITQFMPPNIGAAELTSIINQQAQASGVHPKIDPKGEDKPNGFYQTSKVNIQLEGTYAQVVTFLSYLSRVPRLMTFEQVRVTQASSVGAVVFNGTLVAYRYIKEVPETVAKPAPEKK